MFKSILVPIDLAHRSSWEHALPQAIDLAEASHGSIKLVTVVRDLKTAFEGTFFPFQLEMMISEAEAKLREIISNHSVKNATFSEEVLFGSIGRDIVHAAKKYNADLIVMASHRPEVKDYFIGPNAAYVAQHALCSVLVVRVPADLVH